MAGPSAASGASGAGGSGGVQGAIKDMTDAFNQAIETSAQVTKITTEKKAELDAAKQRPQN